MAFLGASCFGLYSLKDCDRIPLLDAARDGGVRDGPSGASS